MNDETINMELRVTQYLQLRDKIKQMEDEHEKKMKPYKDALEKLNQIMLSHLLHIKTNSVGTGAGTAFVTLKKSANVADGEAFWKYVRANGYFHLLDLKANVVAVAEH